MANFNKAVFFSGSVGYRIPWLNDRGEKVEFDLESEKTLIKEWNWFDHVSNIRQFLGDTIGENECKYILWDAEPNVFAKNTANFRIYDGCPAESSAEPEATIDGFTKGNSIKTPNDVDRLNNLLNIHMPKMMPIQYGEEEEPKTIEYSAHSSPVQIGELSKFVERLTGDDAKLGFPVFSVSDCNSFHNTGYIWGLYAVKQAQRKLGKYGPVIVLNYDYHTDLGSYHPLTDPPNQWIVVRSDGWAKQLLREEELGLSGAVYAVIGQAGNKNAASVHYGEAGGEIKSHNAGDATDAIYWKKLFERLGTGPDYVYITVDRDCLPHHNTQWKTKASAFKGKGGEDQADLLVDHIDATMKAIRQGAMRVSTEQKLKTGQLISFRKAQIKPYLIGFDITGLPEHPAIAQEDANVPQKTAWERVDTDIKKLLACVTPYFAQTPKG